MYIVVREDTPTKTIEVKENEEEMGQAQQNNLSFEYCDGSTSFNQLLTRTKQHFTKVEDSFDLIYNDSKICDDTSFNAMIDNAKQKNISQVLIDLKIKVCIMFWCHCCFTLFFVFIFVFVFVFICLHLLFSSKYSS